MSHFNEYNHSKILRKSLNMLKSPPCHLTNKLGGIVTKTDRLGQWACSTWNCRCQTLLLVIVILTEAISPKNVAPDLCTYHLLKSSKCKFRARRVQITKISANYRVYVDAKDWRSDRNKKRWRAQDVQEVNRALTEASSILTMPLNCSSLRARCTLPLPCLITDLLWAPWLLLSFPALRY